MSSPREERLGRRHPSRTRWLVGMGILAAIIVAVALLAVYAGGGGGSTGY